MSRYRAGNWCILQKKVICAHLFFYFQWMCSFILDEVNMKTNINNYYDAGGTGNSSEIQSGVMGRYQARPSVPTNVYSIDNGLHYSFGLHIFRGCNYHRKVSCFYLLSLRSRLSNFFQFLMAISNYWLDLSPCWMYSLLGAATVITGLYIFLWGKSKELHRK